MGSVLDFFWMWLQFRSGVERLVHIQVSFLNQKAIWKQKNPKFLRPWNLCCWPLHSLQHINICTDSPPLKSLNKQVFSISQPCNVITFCFPTPSITEMSSNLLILKATLWALHRVFNFKWWFQRTLTQHLPELLEGILLSHMQHEQQHRRWAPALQCLCTGAYCTKGSETRDVNMRHGKGASRHHSDMQQLLLFHPGASQDVAVHIKVKGNVHLPSNFPTALPSSLPC